MENSTKNIFFVYNAFIYINALELRDKLKLNPKECVLVVNTFRIKNLRQLLNVIKKEDWLEVHYIFFNIKHVSESQLQSDSNSRHGFFKMLRLYLKGKMKMNALLRKYKQVNLLVNGVYKDYLVSHFANKATYQKYYYLDDGNMTLFVNENIRKEEAKNNFKIKFIEGNYKEKLFYKTLTNVYRLKILPVPSIHFFSSHDLNHYPYDHYERNEYVKLRSLLDEKKHQEDLVFFLGGPLIEINICTEEDYYKLMTHVLEKYKSKKIIYLPHRFENVKELSNLVEKFKFEVLKHDMPIELYLSIINDIPSTIASFYSSALGNLNVFLPNSIQLDAFRIPPEMIIPNNKRRMIGDIYKRYEKIMLEEKRFKVIDFTNN